MGQQMKTELAVANNVMQSRYGIDQIVWMHPAINVLNLGALQDNALRAKVVGIHFIEGKTMYDLALDISTSGIGDYYEAIPLAQVDSFFVMSPEDLEHLNHINDQPDDFKSYASSLGTRSPAEVRHCAQRFQEIRADIPQLRKELGRA